MSNIGKRFAEPAVWEKPYFTALDIKQRLFWLYLNNRCDLAGVHQLHFSVDTAFIGFPIDQQFVDSFLEAVNSDTERIRPLEGQRLWLTCFIRYQQIGRNRDALSSKAGPHISIVNKLKEHGLFKQAIKNDSALFKNFTDEVSENIESSKPASKEKEYPKGRVELPTRKGYSSSDSNSSNKGNSSNQGYSPNTSNIDTLHPKSSLYYFNVAKELKEIMPNHVTNRESNISLESSVQRTIESMENNVDNPKQFLLDRARNIDWKMLTLEDFFKELKS